MPSLTGTLAIRGRVRIVTRRAADDALVYDSGWQSNTVTNTAIQAVVSWLTGTGNVGYNPVPFPRYIELGTGSGTVSPTDTALFTPVAATNTACSILQPVPSSPNEAEWIATFPTSTPVGTYSEAGLFTNSGAMFAHLAGLTINLSSTTTTSLQWVWTISVG